MKLTLPMPPSTNRYWRIDRRGFAYPSDEAKAFKRTVHRKALAAGALRPLEGEVVVDLVVFRARKAGDLDNRIKVALDALRGIAFKDDSQVVAISARREEDPANPRVEVSVEPRGLDYRNDA